MRLSAPRFFAKGRARARSRVMCFVLMLCVGVVLCVVELALKLNVDCARGLLWL